jgi:hypothetical protein
MMATYIASGTSWLRNLSHRAVVEIVAFVVAAVTIAVLAISLAAAGSPSSSGGPAPSRVAVAPNCQSVPVLRPC